MLYSVQKNIRQAEKYIKIYEFSKAEAIYKEILIKFPMHKKALRALKALKTLDKNKTASSYKNEKIQELNNYYNKQKFQLVIQKAHELIKLYPNEIDLYIIEAASNASLHKFKEAISCYENIIKIDPSLAIPYFNIAVMYDALKLPEKAIKNYKDAISIKPNYSDAYNNMGTAYIELGCLDKAIEAYDNVVMITPNHAYAHNNLGNIYMQQRLHDKAIESFKKAIFFDAKYADAFNNLGDAYWMLGKTTKAYKSYERALTINPNHVKGLVNIGLLHLANNENKKSIKAFEKALEIDPNNELALAQKLSQQRYIFEWQGMKQKISQISGLGLKKIKIDPLILFALEDAPDRHRLRAEVFMSNLSTQKHLPANPIAANKSKKIRLGYVSSDFNTHAVSFLILKVLETHDREIFEVCGYSIGPQVYDQMNKKLKKVFDEFKDLDYLNDVEIASEIQKDNIDILIDLNGHTLNSRTGIFAYRPARIQINFLGFPGTMGANFMDYIIADYIVIPAEYNHFYSESIIRLPDTYLPTDNTRVLSKKAMSRKEMGLPDNGIVFCCFNNDYKISPSEFDIWMRVLLKIENSVLWLRTRSEIAKKNIRNEASIRDIDPSRIIFAEGLPIDEHLARYALADIFLDTFNYNGHTTTSEALWAGLPVVTKIGNSFAARVAGSLLTAIGLKELIVNTEFEYENLILQLALNPKELKKIKQKLCKNRLSMPLFDTKKYTANLEKAYSQAYTNFYKGNNSENINISP